MAPSAVDSVRAGTTECAVYLLDVSLTAKGAK